MMSMGGWLGLVSQICFICLLASMIKPHWFRFNGKTPGRMKIGGIWALMLVVSTVGAMSQGGTPTSDTPMATTESATTSDTVMMPMDIAVPQESQATRDVEQAEREAERVRQEAEAPQDRAMDAAKPPPYPYAVQIDPGLVHSQRKVPK